jgi:FixJ family two-component response regulator
MSHEAAQRRVICVVDDDDSVRDAVRGLLRSLGYRAEAFASAEDLLGWTRLDEASCLILDVRMPRMSGLDLQARLAASGRDTPIIFISAHDDDDARRRALAAGAVAFLRKPFPEQALVDAVSAAMGPRSGGE